MYPNRSELVFSMPDSRIRLTGASSCATKVCALTAVALLGSTWVVVRAAPTPEVVQSFRQEIRASFTNLDGGPGTSAGGPPMMRKLVQLGFHDCVSARCDGCVDVMDQKNNGGFEALVSELIPICSSHQIGRADCFAAAASVAVEETSLGGGIAARVPLFFGRLNAPTCSGFTQDNPEAVFPKGEDGIEPTFQYFKRNFNFDAKDTVAIIGAHSLGRAETVSSGFGSGPWTMDPNALDNSFYGDMLDRNFQWRSEASDAREPLWQWISTSGHVPLQVMLNSDMSVIKDVFTGTDKMSGQPTCEFSSCADSPTFSLAQQYAVDNDMFIKDFTFAFVKMVTKGYDICGLEVVPSQGSGVETEDAYGITGLKESCMSRSTSGSGFAHVIHTTVLLTAVVVMVLIMHV